MTTVDAPTPVMLIAGGSGSIGSELALQAAASGWRIALHGRRASSIEAACAAVRQQLPTAQIAGHCADFSAAGSIEALLAEVGSQHGRIDAIVDCSVSAPNGVTGRFAETDPTSFVALAEQSVVVFQRLAHVGLPWLRASRGALVALVSDAGIYAAPRQSMIGAMCAATIGFSRNLAKEWAAEGIRVNVVSPSYVEGTAIVERLQASSQPRLAKARQQAGLGLPTRADSARITGQVISSNGGLSV